MRQTQYNLGAVLDLWRDARKIGPDNPNKEKYLELALRLYVLPKLDTTAQGLEKSEFSAFCEVIAVGQLENALMVFDTEFTLAVEQGKTAKSTGKNYRSAFKQFLQWVEEQPWWKGCISLKTIKTTPTRKKLPPKQKKPRKSTISWSLDKNNLPDYLQQELADFQEFRRTGGLNKSHIINRSKQGETNGFVRRPKLTPVDFSTIKQEEGNILYFLGWYQKQFPNSELHLSLLTNINLLDDFIYCTLEERGVNNSTGVKMTQVAISIVKWLNYAQTKRRNWSDISLILEFRNLKNEYQEDYLAEKRMTDTQKWSQKELTHEEARQVVDYLRSLCAEYSSVKIYRFNKDSLIKEYQAKRNRNLSVVLSAWQTYLMVKLLVYCPVRVEEIEGFVFGESLLRKLDEFAVPYYLVRLNKHKLDKTGKIRHYPLPSILTEDLDQWLFTWRPMLMESLQSSEEWMSLWGYAPNVIEQYQERISRVRQGIINSKIKQTPETYIQEQEKRIKAIQNRLDAWPIAQQNMETYNRVFFSFGKKEAKAFGQPYTNDVLWEIVCRATAISTYALFGEAKWINPHAFRHIGEKHLRLLGKTHLADAFGALIGHSKEMGDEYAKQILSEYEITKGIVDNWWLDN